MKKVKKGYILSFLLGAIIFGGIGTVLAYTILAKDVLYTPNNTTWKVDNVEDAINDLYSKAKTCKKLDTKTTANSNHILSGHTAYNSDGTLMHGGILTYSGDTTITSTTTEQTLSTSGKYMTSDIKIGAIPDYQNSPSGQCSLSAIIGSNNSSDGIKVLEIEHSNDNAYIFSGQSSLMFSVNDKNNFSLTTALGHTSNNIGLYYANLSLKKGDKVYIKRDTSYKYGYALVY